jgi:hypothetical protein
LPTVATACPEPRALPAAPPGVAVHKFQAKGWQGRAGIQVLVRLHHNIGRDPVLHTNTMSKAAKPVEFHFENSITPLECEAFIARAQTLSPSSAPLIKLATHFTDSPFSEAWVSIALGTLLRRAPNARIMVWGATGEPAWLDGFCTTPHGALASTIGRVFVDQRGNSLELPGRSKAIAALNRDVFEKSTSHTLVEFDNDRARRLLELAGGEPIGKKTFEALLKRMRSKLDFGWGNTVHDDVRMRDLSEFLAELYDNAYRHGRLGDSLLQHMLPQVRVVHVKRVVAPTRALLLARSKDAMPIVRDHIAGLPFRKRASLVEITISDYGGGILDHFLASPTGQRASKPRQFVLEQLLHTGLTSRSGHHGAGWGLVNALDAAKKMKAFAAVRTGEFSYARSFLDGSETLRLSPQDNAGGSVPGTHWQFLWGPNE